MRKLPNLDRTVAALEAYDAHWGDEYDVYQSCDLAKAVGIAYGLDTSAFNSATQCAALIRPGPRVPQPGAGLSFVRRMVALHKVRRS